MGYVPDVEGPSVYAPVEQVDVIAPTGTRLMLRFGGLAMDTRTGATHWCGRVLQVTADERQLLGALLRRGGQIVSAERLAAMLGTTSDSIEQRIVALSTALRRAGVTCLPRRAHGLGYVLWRG